MYREFFIRSWLKRHLFWYGLTHMIILSFIDFTILNMADSRGHFETSLKLFLFASLSFFMTFSLEVARKIRPPQAEHPEVDTYSKVIGIGGSMALVHLFQAAVLIVAFLLRAELGLPAWFYGCSVFAWIVVALWFQAWRPRLSLERSLKLDKVASVFFVEFYLSLLAFLAWNTWHS
jgi:hypothetical protein